MELAVTPNVGEGDRLNTVKYVTPTFAGFVASAAWSEDDRVDAALRYAGEFSGFRIAAGIGYQRMTDINNGDGNQGCANPGGSAAISNVNCDSLGLSASVMHSPTGLYLTGAYGERKDNNMAALAKLTNVSHPVNDKDRFFSVQAGLEQKFFGIGKTTVYGEYVKMNTGNGLNSGALRTIAAGDPLTTVAAFIASSEVRVTGFGISQAIDSAAADWYLSLRNYSGSTNTVTAAGAAVNNTGFKDFQAVTTGLQIRF